MKKIRWSDFSLVSKIMIEVGVLAVLLFSINMLFYARINNSMQEMDDVYASNAQITELGQVFDDVQDSMYQYLKVKNSQALMDYYQNEAKYRQELEKLNERNIDDSVKLLEKKIRKMSESYLSCTAGTVAAKRGRNVEKYKQEYDESLELYSYIQSSMDELNKQLFKENSQTYAALRAVMRYLEISNMMIMLLVVICGMFLLIMATREMFLPLTNMAETAQLVGQGNFNVKMPPADSRDELGTVTRAFNTMVDNLGLYIASTAKAGYLGLIHTLTAELAEYGITVNAIAPTVTETPMMTAVIEQRGGDAYRKQQADALPMRRMAVPQDCVGPAVFLASHASDFVTGNIIYPDGGLTAVG